MSSKPFEEGDLILVNVAEKIDHEQWVPGLYLRQFPTDSHVVEVMVNGRRTEALYSRECLRHADEAIDFKVRYEVYPELYGSNCEYYEGVNAKEKAHAEASEWSLQDNCKDTTIAVDRVLIGGTHEARYENGRKQNDERRIQAPLEQR